MNNTTNKNIQKKGFSLLEVLLSIAVFALLVTAVIGALVYGRQSVLVAGQHKRATMIAVEGIEATRSISDSDFGLLVPGPHGLVILNNNWTLGGVSDVVDGFTRSIQIIDVSAGVKNITVTITWPITEARTGSVSLESRLTDWRTSTPATPKWQSPVKTAGLDLPGLNDGIKVAVSGNYAYIIRVDGTPDFNVIDISNPSSPTVVGSLSLNGAPSNLAVVGNYAYVSSSDDNSELQVINVTDPSLPILAGVYNATGTTNALSVAVSGNHAYLTRISSAAAELYAIDVSNPAVPTLTGSLELGGNANDIAIGGSYAYIANGNNGQELQVVNISAPATLSLTGFYNASGNTDAIKVEVVGSTALITRGNQILGINVTMPSTPAILTNYNAVGTINDLTVDVMGGFVFLATTSATSEFEIVDFSAPATPTQVGTYNIAGNSLLSGLAYHSTQDKVYGVGPLDTEELFIWAPY